MIVFDLKCPTGHVFEAWFGSSTDWEEQRARSLVTCPMCGVSDVEKAVMAPAVGAKGNQRAPHMPQDGGNAPVPVAASEDPAQAKEMLARLARLQQEMVKDADYVGTRFADEARAMHLGDSEKRHIYGETSLNEARALIDEGVPLTPLPLPMTPRRSDA